MTMTSLATKALRLISIVVLIAMTSVPTLPQSASFLRAVSTAATTTGAVGFTVGTDGSPARTVLSVAIGGGYPDKHTVKVAVTGAPATCTVALEGDLTQSPASWPSLSGDIDCTADVEFHVVNKAVSFIRVNVTALTGGTDPTVTVNYLAVRN